MIDFDAADERLEVKVLFANLQAALPTLEQLREKCNDRWARDGVYRFYHQSFKVYALQDLTLEIVNTLQALAPPVSEEMAQFSEEVARNARSENARRARVHKAQLARLKRAHFPTAPELRIPDVFQAGAPLPLNKWFMQIVREGTGKTFSAWDNKNWFAATRPIVEAFFHASFFLEMAVKYGRELEYPPGLFAGGWGAFLYLYNLR